MRHVKPRKDENPGFNFDQFEVGQVVEYNFSSLVDDPSDPRSNTWHVGVLAQIDRSDPGVPWFVTISEEHQKSGEFDTEEWFHAGHVRAHTYVIDEEDELV